MWHSCFYTQLGVRNIIAKTCAGEWTLATGRCRCVVVVVVVAFAVVDLSPTVTSSSHDNVRMFISHMCVCVCIMPCLFARALGALCIDAFLPSPHSHFPFEAMQNRVGDVDGSALAVH